MIDHDFNLATFERLLSKLGFQLKNQENLKVPLVF